MQLKSLELAENKLSGPLVDELGKLSSLTNLTTLILNDNNFVGSIPHEVIPMLCRLDHFDLSGNRSDNTAVAGLVRNLENIKDQKTISLSRKGLTGRLPNSLCVQLGTLGELTKLELPHNQLSGPLPEELLALTNLTSLELCDNAFSGPLPKDLAKLTRLTSLVLYKNRFTGQIPNELGMLSHLEDLELQLNQLTGPIPQGLGDLINLKNLDLSSNQLSGSLPEDLGGLVSLRTLLLQHNALSGELPLSVVRLNANGVIFRLADNDLGFTLPGGFGNIRGVAKLNLSKCSLTGSLPRTLPPSLASLDLSKNAITDGIPSGWGVLTNLKDLNLSSCALCGPLGRELGESLVNLKTLWLSNNDLSGPPLPDTLQLLAPLASNLEVLSLGGNALGGAITSVITAFIRLKRLVLNDMKLEGATHPL